jgi:hypothetical protein
MKAKQGKSTMPDSLRRWVASQATAAPPAREAVFPFSEFWWKAVACVLLSGRVKPKWEKKAANLTDVHRFCKEANFNPYYFQNAAEVLVAGEVVSAKFNAAYEPGKRFKDFWSRDLARIQAVAHHALVSMTGVLTPSYGARHTRYFDDAVGLLRSFFTALEGKALPAKQMGKALLGFSALPEQDLASFTGEKPCVSKWKSWLDDPGQTALINALYIANWAYETTLDKQDWFCLTPTGRIMLGLETAPPAPPEVKEFKVLPDRSVLAGIDLEPETLAVLFRHCKTKHIDQVIQFRVDKTALQEMPSATDPARELLRVLEPCAPLPATVLDVLGERAPAGGGVIFYRPCRGLVKVGNPELLSAIRAHPRLKGYLDREAPPGYLVIKEGADAYNFLRRCAEHGFEVKGF